MSRHFAVALDRLTEEVIYYRSYLPGSYTWTKTGRSFCKTQVTNALFSQIQKKKRTNGYMLRYLTPEEFYKHEKYVKISAR